MPEILELPRKKRRPRPLRELDQAARTARLKLEREIFREPLVPLLLKFTPDQLQRVDDERRVAAYGNIPSRCATIRQLIDEALMWRRSMRPKDRPKGQPFEIDVADWPDDL
jgi:hypothetical protein